MPSVLQQHGFWRSVKTTKLDATSAHNPDLVLRVPKNIATVAALTRDRFSAVAVSKGAPLLLRPRDILTLHVAETPVVMSVLGVYPLAALCQRRAVIDRTVLLLVVA